MIAVLTETVLFKTSSLKRGGGGRGYKAALSAANLVRMFIVA